MALLQSPTGMVPLYRQLFLRRYIMLLFYVVLLSTTVSLRLSGPETRVLTIEIPHLQSLGNKRGAGRIIYGQCVVKDRCVVYHQAYNLLKKKND